MPVEDNIRSGGTSLTSLKDTALQEVQEIRVELGRLLDGMDYCLDWKPEDEEWSAREVIYHIVDTPSQGIQAAVQGVLQGAIGELSVTASLTNMTQERQSMDLEQVQQDVETVLSGLERALATATDAEIQTRKVVFHSVTRSRTEDRTAENLVSGLFVRHWREHLAQLAALRDMLGLD
jgi:hypothetical protein